MADKKCTIAWVKAHVETEGNEAADEVARQGAENKDLTIKLVNTPAPSVTRKEIIDNAIRQEWRRKWDNAPHYKHMYKTLL